MSILECVTFRGDHLWETWRRYFVLFLFSSCSFVNERSFAQESRVTRNFFCFVSTFLNNAKERKKIFDWLVLPK